MSQNKIYYIDKEVLNSSDIVNEIYLNEELNYYWSDDFSTEFYIKLAYLGFISVAFKEKDKTLLLPEMQFEYAILDFKDLHISKKVKRLLKKEDYQLFINKDLKKVIEQINTYHDESWLVFEEYISLLEELKSLDCSSTNFELLTFELYDKTDEKLICAEVGYKIGRTYTSLSGFCIREKKYNNYGKLQLVLLAKYLDNNNFDFWNLGHPYMDYKFDLGAKKYSRKDFLNRWIKSR